MFNIALHHKKWPHKFEGNGEKGEIGQKYGFSLAVAAESIFNSQHYSNNTDHLSTSFQYFFLKLAYDIATYASTLPSTGFSF